MNDSRILNGDDIKEGLRVKLVRRFSSIEAGTIGVIEDYENTEFGDITDISIRWESGSLVPYIIDQNDSDRNIIQYLIKI